MEENVIFMTVTGSKNKHKHKSQKFLSRRMRLYALVLLVYDLLHTFPECKLHFDYYISSTFMLTDNVSLGFFKLSFAPAQRIIES